MSILRASSPSQSGSSGRDPLRGCASRRSKRIKRGSLYGVLVRSQLCRKSIRREQRGSCVMSQLQRELCACGPVHGSVRCVRAAVRLVSVCLVVLFARGAVRAQNVVTQHNDNSRSGANNSEAILTPSNVNTSSFGKLFSQTVDGQIYAQ